MLKVKPAVSLTKKKPHRFHLRKTEIGELSSEFLDPSIKVGVARKRILLKQRRELLLETQE